MRRTPSLPIKDIINAWMEEEPSTHEKLLGISAENAVKNQLGQMVKYVRRIHIDEGNLYLYLGSPSLKQHLLSNKLQFIARINQDIGAELIREVFFY